MVLSVIHVRLYEHGQKLMCLSWAGGVSRRMGLCYSEAPMEMAYRLILYILLANVGFMIFSLARQGFRMFSGYIAQLGVLASFMVFLLGRDLAGFWGVTAAGAGIFVLVGMPMLIQRRIEGLISEQRFDEIEPLARWKSWLAWSDLNSHLHDVALALTGISDNPEGALERMRALMPRGEPFDGTTRIFIGITLFNQRRFELLLNVLHDPARDWSSYPFEELIYIVRALLETGRHEEAMEAQTAIERLVPRLSSDQLSNLVVCRLLFYAMMGWHPEFEAMLETDKAAVDALPPALRLYWRGIAACYAGRSDEGRQLLESALREGQSELPDKWIVWMRQRIEGLAEQREFFETSLVPRLAQVRLARRDGFLALASENARAVEPPQMAERATKRMMNLLFGIFVVYLFAASQDDLLDLMRFGANSGFLVREGEWFRLVTYQFLHLGWLHLFMNLLALKYFGPPVETILGWPLFLGVYLFSGVCGGIATAWNGAGLSVGASAAVLGLLGAAISLELFGGPRAKALSRQGQFSTLVFILIVNLAIGAVEKGIDNSAHLGGLAGGAVAGIVLARLIESPALATLASAISMLFVVTSVGTAAIQFTGHLGPNRYPAKYATAQFVQKSVPGLGIELPPGWSIESSTAPQPGWVSAVVTGPFHERIDLMSGPGGGDSPAEVVEAYIEHRTRVLIDTAEIQFESRRDPVISHVGGNECRMVSWRLRAEDRVLTQNDWFIFPPGTFILAQCLLPTGRDDLYTPLLERILGSVTSRATDK